METFDLESHLQDAYSRFPEAKHQPVIGLTANYEGIDATLRDRYYKQVIAAGGTSHYSSCCRCSGHRQYPGAS